MAFKPEASAFIMNDVSKPRSGHEWLTAVMVILPVAYGLSFGPVVGYSEHHHVPGMDGFCRQFYAPVVWLHDNTPLRGIIERYASYWGFN